MREAQRHVPPRGGGRVGIGRGRGPAAPRRSCSSSPASASSRTWSSSRPAASAPPTALNLAAAGLAADERGRLTVDACFRTAVPHIFAAGDVIGYPSLAATSGAGPAGRLPRLRRRRAAPMAAHFPIGIYAIPEISMVGATEQELTAAEGAVRDGRGPLPGDRARARSWATTAVCSRCSSTGRPAAPGRPLPSAPARPS